MTHLTEAEESVVARLLIKENNRLRDANVELNRQLEQSDSNMSDMLNRMPFDRSGGYWTWHEGTRKKKRTVKRKTRK